MNCRTFDFAAVLLIPMYTQTLTTLESIRVTAAIPFAIVSFALTLPAFAQGVECSLTQSRSGQLRGSCEGSADFSWITLRQVEGSNQEWSGLITFRNQQYSAEIVAAQNDSDYVLRSNVEWFNVSEWDPTVTPAPLVFDVTDVAAPTSADVAILFDARRRLLATPNWDKSDDRNCENDAEGTVGLFCALAQATTDWMGEYYHRQPAMQQVRRAISNDWSHRVINHRLKDFNNHPDTTLDDVLTMLDRAVELSLRDVDDLYLDSFSVEILKRDWVGDANLDGQFDSGDLVEVFQAGKYETDEFAGWRQGDWNVDQLFGSSDLVLAFQGGDYEAGPRTSVSAVPEPSSWFLAALGLIGMGRVQKR